MNLCHPVRIGSAELPGNLFLAPVAGYSDAAFRSVCFGLGADLCYSEMVSAEALVRGHPGTGLLMDRAEDETRYAIQLFGSKPETLARAAVAAAAPGPSSSTSTAAVPCPRSSVRRGLGPHEEPQPDP